MKPDTPLLQLTAREFATMLAWAAALRIDKESDVERAVRSLFNEPPSHEHQWKLGHSVGRFGYPYHADCECGIHEVAESREGLFERLRRYGPVILK